MSWQDEVRRLQAEGKHDQVIEYIDLVFKDKGVVFPPPTEWKEAEIILRYTDGAFVEGGWSRCEPTNLAQLVQELDRYYNCSSDHPGCIELRLKAPDES